MPVWWMSRWQTICDAHGLDVGDRTAMLGEAVQALAALPSSRALIEKGGLPELRGRLHAALDGLPRRKLNNDRLRARGPPANRVYFALRWRRGAFCAVGCSP